MKSIQDMTTSQKQALKDAKEYHAATQTKVEFIGFNKWESDKAMFLHSFPDGTTQLAKVGKRGAYQWGIRY